MRLVKKWKLRQVLLKLVDIRREDELENYRFMVLGAIVGGAKKMPKRPAILTKNITDG